MDEGRLKAIEEKIGAGDFLFIQFGHNDEKKGHEICPCPKNISIVQENKRRENQVTTLLPY